MTPIFNTVHEHLPSPNKNPTIFFLGLFSDVNTERDVAKNSIVG